MNPRAALLGVVALASAGCQRQQVEGPPAPTPSSTPAPPLASATLEVPPPRGPVALKILSPKEGEVIPAKGPAPVSVTFSLSGYELQNDGQHLHIVLDNSTYEACYDLSTPFTFKYPIAPGIHTIRAFPVGGPMTEGVSLHESLKDPNAFAVTTFFVGKPDPKEPRTVIPPGEPLLTFSWPQGEFIGEKAKKIMLDFWVQNATLGPEAYKVKYKVNGGREVTLTEWKKTFLEGLPAGDSVIEVWLVGPDGAEVAGPFNRIRRKLSLKEFSAKPLFERVGGQAAIEAVVRDLLYFISKDKALAKRFAKADLERIQSQLSVQLCEVSGGPCGYAGKSMKAAHQGMKISGKEFDALLGALVSALEKNKIPEREQRELIAALDAMRPQIVEK